MRYEQYISIRDSGGGSCTSREWIRNPDWLDMPTTVDGDNVIYLLVAVRDNAPNFLSLYCTTSSGNYTVDLYNDGTTISSHASGSQANFDLDYTKGQNEIAKDGYKQVMVKITGNLTKFDLYRIHPDVQVGHGICSGVLSVKITSQTINSLRDVLRGNANRVFHRMAEEFEFFGTSNVTVFQNSFYETRKMGKIKGDFSNGVNFNSAFAYTGDFDASELIMPSSGVTNFSQSFAGSFKREFSSPNEVSFFSGVIYPATTFSAGFVELLGTPSNPVDFTSLSNINGFYQAFQNQVRLTQAHFVNAAPLGMYRAFLNDYSLTTVTGIDGSGVTNMTQTFQNCYSLSWLRITGLTVSFTLEDCNFSREGLVQVFNDLGIASATITITNNPGVPNLTPADIAIATGKGWTVTT